jgi:hypothetical protein
MYKIIRKAAWVVGLCIISVALSGNARAEHFDFDFTPAPPNGSTPYSWFYQGINLDYGGGYQDGREDSLGHDDPNGNIPYFIFDGTDRSQFGHCLEISVGPPDATSLSPNGVQSLDASTTDMYGNPIALFTADASSSGGYGTAYRIWIQNTGAGLYWRVKLADEDGLGGAWNQSAIMNIWRFEYNEADCTTNSGLSWVQLVGTTGNYTVTNRY